MQYNKCFCWQVYSGYRIALKAKEKGIPMAIVNIGKTRADKLAQLKISSRCGHVLHQWFSVCWAFAVPVCVLCPFVRCACLCAVPVCALCLFVRCARLCIHTTKTEAMHRFVGPRLSPTEVCSASLCVYRLLADTASKSWWRHTHTHKKDISCLSQFKVVHLRVCIHTTIKQVFSSLKMATGKEMRFVWQDNEVKVLIQVFFFFWGTS